MTVLRFVDLFAGMGGFHRALSELGHECVFACEIDPELRALYHKNFRGMKRATFGDIREAKNYVPPHDLLCAGFPCQPFSKSGAQLGARDETRGTLFHEILEILEKRRPEFVLLENVGNFARHDGGRTWRIVRRRLEALGYDVAGTEHVTPIASTDWRDVGGIAAKTKKILTVPQKARVGSGLLSPHHFGLPHHRERFFIVASLSGLPRPAFPERDLEASPSLSQIVQTRVELTALDLAETKLSDLQRECIYLWNDLLERLPMTVPLPSFPIWGDEALVTYPYWPRTPYASTTQTLRTSIGRKANDLTREEILCLLPSYAREESTQFRNWKAGYIARNREWWSRVRRHLPKKWFNRLASLPPSYRKLEWNVKGGERDLWRYVLQFRPSGLRAKRYSSSPALVAMTTTQIPVLGPQRRFLTRTEGLRLQGFPDSHRLPLTRAAAFRAVGNAVHVEVIKRVAMHLLSSEQRANKSERYQGGKYGRRVA